VTAGAAGRTAGLDASGFAASGFATSAVRSCSVPVQLATTNPVTSAVAMLSAIAMAVTFHGFQVFMLSSFARNRAGYLPLP
jgi:hypothetical protein